MYKLIKVAVVFFIITTCFISHTIFAETGTLVLEIQSPEAATSEGTFTEPPVIVLSPVNIHLEIISGDNNLYNADISVVSCDSDNDPTTLNTITGYCAVVQSGLASDWNWDWAPGAYVNSIDDIDGFLTKDKDNNDVYHYWSWSLNGSYGEAGLNQYEIKQNDVISLNFIDPVEEISQLTVSTTSVSSGSSSSYASNYDNIFSIEKAISFIYHNQKSDGSFGSSLYTDWVAIGLAHPGSGSDAVKSKLKNYLENQDFESSVVTDNERHSMALMALGINPYNGTPVNYIEKIVSTFDGYQIGDNREYNDDIFGLIVLSNAGYDERDEIIKKIIPYIISHQSAVGMWGSVDMTAATIQSLQNFQNFSGVGFAVAKAETFLANQQKEDGGYGNSSRTSWAISALALNNSYKDQVEKGVKYIANNQEQDGGLDGINNDSRIWATAYSLPGILRLSWNEILQDFPKNRTDDSLVDGKYKEKLLLEKSDIAKDTIKITKEEKIIIPIVNNQIKNIAIQNKKIIPREITTQTIKEEDNHLSASVAISEDNHNGFLSFVDGLVSKIKAPFVWLWLHIVI